MESKVEKPGTAQVADSKLSGTAEAPASAAGVFAAYEELAELGRENFAAVLRANAALAEGMETIGKEVMEYARNSLETAAEAATALLAAKTLDDVVQLNSDYAKASFDRMIAGSTKVSEIGVTLANEALAPIGDRVEATIHRLGKPLAA